MYDSKEEEKQHNLTETQHSQTSHCQTQQPAMQPSDLFYDLNQFYSTGDKLDASMM